jgi:hypothetical protein
LRLLAKVPITAPKNVEDGRRPTRRCGRRTDYRSDAALPILAARSYRQKGRRMTHNRLFNILLRGVAIGGLLTVLGEVTVYVAWLVYSRL